MKAIEVATKNFVLYDDVLEICKELGISCVDESSELNDNEVFLIERRIESVKKRKVEEAQKARKSKKIKLKKKVEISDDIKKKKGMEITRGGESGETEMADEDRETPAGASAESEITKETGAEKKGEPKREREGQQGKRPAQRPSRGTQGDRKPYERRPDGQQGVDGRERPSGGQRADARSGGYRTEGRPGGQRTDSRPAGQRTEGRPGGQRPDRADGRARPQGQGTAGARGGFRTRPGGKDEAPAPIEIDDAAVKKQKGQQKEREKEKEKEKEFRRLTKKEKEEIEKDIILKKKHAQEQKRLVSIPEKINITESITVGDLAKKLNVKASEVIGRLMKLGVMATIDQAIDSDTASILASEYNTEVDVVTLYDETVIKNEQEDKAEDYVSRPPVVTVMGHVDHGKTRLLDAIREANVIDSEFGGITQHIGAYTVNVRDKKITFLDTPGHAAFTTMRARGASITDIVILVVAANDGVMPQTIEAISHAKAANVPIIVAINKIDLEDANPAKVRQELTSYELVPEEWGGTTLFAEISAKKKQNIEELLELVLIQAEMLELKSNPKLIGKGTVIESRLDPGRGAVCTVLVQSGTLHVGDSFVVGMYSGKIRAMFDDKGAPIQDAGPSSPVEILGISGVPAAGDPFEGVESDRFAKQISQKRLEYKRIESAKKVRKVTLESLNEMIKEGEVQELCIIVKADVDGSAQALTESLEKLSNNEVRVKVIHSGTGGINDSDVMLASASNAVIIGYHVRPTGKVSDLADKENVSIRFYNIIFEATDDIKAAMEGMLSPIIEQKVTGTGEIRQIFKVSKVGTIAGSVCMSGKVSRKSKMRIIRDGVVIFDGALSSLKRYKDDVSAVEAGQEFGFTLTDFNDIKENDHFEAYEVVETAKKLE
jgi:translation initiation factor IF-2